ncbi:formylglycine-generating enzyme family protein [uncultured Flavobacterium sp.]|uniref:formylglycine-generating enzyme family protein n=1 Tax=uncultured Flavobacterium sp. TaxID=165435 RepID=UPI0025CE13E2|nr:formylglycine-generating enzyme family protein [uncultured Flavobacterium sp.]
MKITVFFLAALLLMSFRGVSSNRASSLTCFISPDTILVEKPNKIKTPQGMVWVKGKIFIQGAKEADKFGLLREKPGHQVAVDGFFIDITEVTNKQFKNFVEATGYKTVAERPVNWNELEKDLPPGTPKPHDSILQPGSLCFNKCVGKVASMNDYSQWWNWQNGTDWRHPEGPESSINGKDNFPVVHVAYEDALAYCQWANRRLPTEAEWESAAQGNLTDPVYTWGDNPEVLYSHANTWQGVFPIENKSKDGFEYLAPVKSYPPNSIGIYDMLGNVWEMTSDWFNEQYYEELEKDKVIKNPKGAAYALSYNNPNQPERIIKGGSFLCNASYCASYRISAKMGMAQDSGTNHIGFRTVATVSMLK